jgi:hypothetical protein
MLNVIKLNVIMLSVIMLNVIMLSVVFMNVVTLNVVAPFNRDLQNGQLKVVLEASDNYLIDDC